MRKKPYVDVLEKALVNNTRFTMSELDGMVTIYDILNTEPVCQIWATYHPYAPKIILDALNGRITDNEFLLKRTIDIFKREEE